MLPAQAVHGGANLAVVGFGVTVIFLTSGRADGIYNEVGMHVFPVRMDSDDRLIAGKLLLRKFLCNLQGKFRCYLTRLKGQDQVIVLNTSHFTHCLFGFPHLPCFPTRIAVQMGSQYLFLCLAVIKDITDCCIQFAFSRQYFDNGHCRLPPEISVLLCWYCSVKHGNCVKRIYTP